MKPVSCLCLCPEVHTPTVSSPLSFLCFLFLFFIFLFILLFLCFSFLLFLFSLFFSYFSSLFSPPPVSINSSSRTFHPSFPSLLIYPPDSLHTLSITLTWILPSSCSLLGSFSHTHHPPCLSLSSLALRSPISFPSYSFVRLSAVLYFPLFLFSITQFSFLLFSSTASPIFLSYYLVSAFLLFFLILPSSFHNFLSYYPVPSSSSSGRATRAGLRLNQRDRRQGDVAVVAGGVTGRGRVLHQVFALCGSLDFPLQHGAASSFNSQVPF